MAPPTFCLYAHGLFGPSTPQVPVYGAHDAIRSLEHALHSGPHANINPSQHDQSENALIFRRCFEALQNQGEPSLDILRYADVVIADKDDHENEPYVPHVNVANIRPPFKTIDISWILSILRSIAGDHERKHGSKPILQLGIVTMIVDGAQTYFTAHAFPAEEGNVTHTIWVFRSCHIDANVFGDYTEHWTPFVPGDHADAPSALIQGIITMGAQHNQAPPNATLSYTTPFLPASSSSDNVLPRYIFLGTAGSMATQYSTNQFPNAPHTDLPSTVSPSDLMLPQWTAQQYPMDLLTAPTTFDAPPDFLPDLLPNIPAEGTATPERARKPKFRPLLDPTGMTDHEIFSLDPLRIQDATILRLAEYLTNKQIFERINEHHPAKQLRNRNVITKRISEAVKRRAKLTGRPVDDVRDELNRARASNGVRFRTT